MPRRKSVQEKLAEANIKINRHYSFYASDASDIVKANIGLCDQLLIAFEYGYLQGTKATKKEYEEAKSTIIS